MSRLLGGFVGSVVLVGHFSCHGHDGGAVLVGCRRCGALSQESPPLVLLVGVFSVWRCPSVLPTPIFLVPVLTLKGGDGVIGVIPRQLRSSIGLPCAW
jgi:hypothetical protein